jgi:uncharacterized membrane protein YhhN
LTSRPNDRVDLLLVGVALAAALAYFAALTGARATLGWALVKTIPMSALAALALRRRLSEGAGLLAAALALDAAGDLLLELAPLLAGVGAFLAGHLVYALLFFRLRERWGEVGGGAKLRLGLLLIGVALVAPGLVVGAPPALRAPIALYVGALAMMAALAQLTRRGLPVALGALLFVVSDALLGASWFGGAQIAGGSALIWPSYVAGQLLIALGVLRARQS